MKQLSSHAACAKAIRQELKKKFPNTKFSVTSQTYSMGDSIRINWMDGATTEAVNNVVRKYQYGSFDGMTDSYNYTNSRSDIPQVKYVQCSRSFSVLTELVAFEFLKGYYQLGDIRLDDSTAELNKRFDCWTPRNLVYRRLVKLDLSHGLKLAELSQ